MEKLNRYQKDKLKSLIVKANHYKTLYEESEDELATYMDKIAGMYA
jgi:hypothetical protein